MKYLHTIQRRGTLLEIMSRRKSNSVFDIPSTPLMREPPDNPFDESEDQSSEEVDDQADNPPPTPRNFVDDEDDIEGRRKKKFACAGEKQFNIPLKRFLFSHCQFISFPSLLEEVSSVSVFVPCTLLPFAFLSRAQVYILPQNFIFSQIRCFVPQGIH